MVPPELADIAADYILAAEDITTTRTALHAERTTLLAALGSVIRQRKAMYASMALHAIGLVALAVVIIIGLSHTFG